MDGADVGSVREECRSEGVSERMCRYIFHDPGAKCVILDHGGDEESREPNLFIGKAYILDIVWIPIMPDKEGRERVSSGSNIFLY